MFDNGTRDGSLVIPDVKEVIACGLDVKPKPHACPILSLMASPDNPNGTTLVLEYIQAKGKKPNQRRLV